MSKKKNQSINGFYLYINFFDILINVKHTPHIPHSFKALYSNSVALLKLSKLKLDKLSFYLL